MVNGHSATMLMGQILIFTVQLRKVYNFCFCYFKLVIAYY